MGADLRILEKQTCKIAAAAAAVAAAEAVAAAVAASRTSGAEPMSSEVLVAGLAEVGPAQEYYSNLKGSAIVSCPIVAAGTIQAPNFADSSF